MLSFEKTEGKREGSANFVHEDFIYTRNKAVFLKHQDKNFVAGEMATKSQPSSKTITYKELKVCQNQLAMSKVKKS